MSALPDVALEEAATWLMRFHEGPFSLEQELELELWLNAHAANREALAHVSQAWQSVGEAADLPELISARADALGAMHAAANRDRWQVPFPGRWKAVGALAACLLLAIVVAFHSLPGGETYRTAVGERRVIALADGSRLSLDAASAVEVRYDKERRALRLLSGRAKFDVAKDPRRPFAVSVGERMVVATGTAFGVELVHSEVRVTLYEGSVAVLENGPADQAPRPVLSANGKTPVDRALTPGTALVVPAARSAFARIEAVDVPRTLSWEQGQLVFSDEPLAVAMERVNRYSAATLKIEDAATAALPISGAFNAGDTEGFVDGVRTLYGVRIIRRNKTILLAPPSA